MGRGQVTFQMNGEVGIIAFIGKEQGNSCSSTWSVVVSKFCKWKEHIPVVLLVVAENLKILFQGLVSPFHLTITFQVVT